MASKLIKIILMSLKKNTSVNSKVIYNYNNLYFIEKLFVKIRIPFDLSFFNYRFIKELIFNNYKMVIIFKGFRMFDYCSR